MNKSLNHLRKHDCVHVKIMFHYWIEVRCNCMRRKVLRILHNLFPFSLLIRHQAPICKQHWVQALASRPIRMLTFTVHTCHKHGQAALFPDACARDRHATRFNLNVPSENHRQESAGRLSTTININTSKMIRFCNFWWSLLCRSSLHCWFQFIRVTIISGNPVNRKTASIS